MPKNKTTFVYKGVTYKTSDKTALRMLERGNAAGAAKRLAGQSSGAKYRGIYQQRVAENRRRVIQTGGAGEKNKS